MLKQIEGSQAIVRAVAACCPNVISAYPISPQIHIVEALSALVKSGQLEHCEYVNVKNKFSAMSVCIGASAAGARAYTATASQGLLYMVETVYSASGLRMPIVTTVANRTIDAPINIWNDHTDSMSQRDSGWPQLFAENNQEAVDLHVQAFRIAEEPSIPAMVYMDGLILTHAAEQIDLPEQDQVDRFLSPYEPRQVLDPDDPISIGVMVGPKAFIRVRYPTHHKQMEALELVPQVRQEFKEIFGRDSGGLVHPHRCEDADVIVTALGLVTGTIRDVVDERREKGEEIGVLGICSLRPFPLATVREVLQTAKITVSFEKAFSVGIGGIASAQLRAAMRDRPLTCYDVIGGLGGRNMTKKSLNAMLNDAIAGRLQPLTLLDLDMRLVNAELECKRTTRRSGPMAEDVMRGAVEHTNANLAARGVRPPADKAGIAQAAAPSTRANAINVLLEGNN